MQTQVDILRVVAETLEKNRNVLLAVVYGSVARDVMRPESDVDVAVLCSDVLDADEKQSLILELTAGLDREVDLADLRAVEGELLKQILTRGKVVLKRDTAAYAALIKKMIYNQEDYMPYYRRSLRERMERFLNGPGRDRE